MAFRCRFLDLSIAGYELFLPASLALDGTFRIQRPRLAISAEVIVLLEVLVGRHSTMLVDVVAFGMLPSVAFVAIHCVAIVLLKPTNAFDGIVFELVAR